MPSEAEVRRDTPAGVFRLAVLALAGVVFLVSFTLTGLGFVIAWKMNSSQGFHAIMNLLLVPMWMVSGSLFPMSTAHGWVRALMWVNPLTYSIAAMNHLMGLERLTGGPGLWPSLAVTIGFGLALLVASGLLAAQKSERSSA